MFPGARQLAEHALDTEDDIVTVGRQGLEQGLEVATQVAVIDNRAGRVQPQACMVLAWRSMPA